LEHSGNLVFRPVGFVEEERSRIPDEHLGTSRIVVCDDDVTVAPADDRPDVRQLVDLAGPGPYRGSGHAIERDHLGAPPERKESVRYQEVDDYPASVETH
jgi:hypothetical protein